MQSATILGRRPAVAHKQLVGGLGFDRLVVALGLWFLGGLYLDGWAHLHVPGLETFFTPWHGILYSGFFAVATALIGAIVLNLRQGATWREAIPAGYELSVLGVVLFGIGGVGDMLWHILFGIEASVEALLSPTHLLLATGLALMVSGPLRAAWRRSDTSSWATRLPALLAITMLLSLWTFFTQYAHPFGTTWAAQSYRPAHLFADAGRSVLLRLEFLEQAVAIAGVLLQTGLLMGLLLPVLRRWTLPFGGLTLVFTLNTVLMAFMRDQSLSTGRLPLIALAAVAGLLADLLSRRLPPSTGEARNLRIVAFAIPVLLYGLYFATLFLTGGIWWSIHLWTGTVVLAGIAGWLLSFVIAPSRAQPLAG